MRWTTACAWFAVCGTLWAGGCADGGPGADGETVLDTAADVLADTGAVDVKAAEDVVKPVDSGPAQEDAAEDTGAAADSGGADAGAAPVDAGPKVPHQCAIDADCLGRAGINPCLGKLFCDTAGDVNVCRNDKSSAPDCDTSKDTVCLQTACDPVDGQCKATMAGKGTPCDDGVACTVDSACDKGECVAGDASWCQCKSEADCKAFEDGNVCTGTLYCDLSSFPYQCKVKAQSVVKCAADKDTACAKNACNPDTGKCAMTPEKEGTPCDDGVDTTIGDACKAGKCAAGIVPPCKHDKDCEAQEDGNACNGELFCDKGSGKCVVNPITVITCPTVDDTPCRVNTCEPGTGACTPKARKNGTPCDDGDSCTAGDACVAGKCKPGTTFKCACKTDSECVSYDDGDLCNGTWYCNKANKNCEFNPATKVLCQAVSDTACLKSACHPKVGKCQLTIAGAVESTCDLPAGEDGKPRCRAVAAKLANPVTVTCNDGNPCTVGDTCDSKTAKCVAGTTKIC